MTERFYTQITEDSAGNITYTTFSSKYSVPIKVEIYHKQLFVEEQVINIKEYQHANIQS